MAAAAKAAPNPLAGALWMVLSCAILSLLAGLGRHLSAAGMHPFEIVFFRLLFALLVMMPWLMSRGVGVLKTERLRLYMVRACISMGAMTTWFWSISLVPIGEVTALSFLAPLFTTVGAALVLGEVVRRRRWTATLIGFLGALVIIRPGLIEMQPGHWMALSSAVFMGTSALVVKSLTNTESPATVVFYANMIMTPLALVPALFVWQTPALEVWPYVVAMGPIAAVGHITLTRAFAAADASMIAPFDFARLPFAVLIGFLAFGELIDSWTWVGAGIIFVASVYIARREAQLGAQRPPTAPGVVGPAAPDRTRDSR